MIGIFVGLGFGDTKEAVVSEQAHEPLDAGGFRRWDVEG